MLSLDFIRKHQKEVEKAAEEKGIDSQLIRRFLALDKKRRSLLEEIEALRAQRNQLAKERDIEKGREIKALLKKKEPLLKETEEEFQKLLLWLPNIPAPQAPRGKDEMGNRVVKKWGKIPSFDFSPLSHLELGKKWDLLDLEKGAAVSGFRGYYLKNEAALLHFAVLFYSWKKIIEKGFQPFFPPSILKEFALVGSGHFPFGKEDIYRLENTGKEEALYLSGTAEPSLLAYFAGRTLEEKDLPVTVCGWTQCYRREAGSYGRDTKGLYRLHEFMKVEQVVLTPAETAVSSQWLIKIREFAEEILQDLELPYRVVEVCTGDMGAGKYQMFDIETYMPSCKGYGETHSVSNLTDWQARRLKIRYRDKDGKTRFVHTLNSTMIASPRILIAILENYQQKDGSILIPKVLQPLVGKEKIGE